MNATDVGTIAYNVDTTYNVSGLWERDCETWPWFRRYGTKESVCMLVGELVGERVCRLEELQAES